ncbi:MAG: hypothetical protein ACLQPN_00730 [Bryobacteraceae bacterium]
MPQDQKKQGREYFAATTTPSTINDDQRTVDVVWFTGIDVPRSSWDGPYIRRFDPKGVDLSLLNNRAPVFDNHSTQDGTESQKGVVEKAWVDGNLYKATLRFSKRPAVDDLWRDIKDKVVCKFSMGVEILAEHEIKVDGQPRVRLADQWRPFEISCAPLPADFGTDTLTGSGQQAAMTQGPASADEDYSGRRPWASMSVAEWAAALRRQRECDARTREIEALRLS